MQYTINQDIGWCCILHGVFHKKRLITLKCTGMTTNDIEGPFWALRLSG